jgi:hypothetical protein
MAAKKAKKADGFRFLIAASLVSSHANGETSENHNRAEKRRPGRPRNSPLDPIEQALARRQRHRESKRNAGMVPAEIWLPKGVARCSNCARRNPSGRGAGSFPVAYGALGEKLRETALRVQPSTSNLHMLTKPWPVEQTESRERGLSGVAQRRGARVRLAGSP